MSIKTFKKSGIGINVQTMNFANRYIDLVMVENVLKLGEANHLTVAQIIKPRLLLHLNKVKKIESLQGQENERIYKLAHQLHPVLDKYTYRDSIITIRLYNMQGEVIASSLLDEIGGNIANDFFFHAIKTGDIVSEIKQRNNNTSTQSEAAHLSTLESFIPIIKINTPIHGVLVIQSDISTLVNHAKALQWNTRLGVSIVAGVLYIILLLCMLLAGKLLKLHPNSGDIENICDPLTGLPNRRQFVDELAHALERARNDKKLVALILIDLDYFKQITSRPLKTS